MDITLTFEQKRAAWREAISYSYPHTDGGFHVPCPKPSDLNAIRKAIGKKDSFLAKMSAEWASKSPVILDYETPYLRSTPMSGEGPSIFFKLLSEAVVISGPQKPAFLNIVDIDMFTLINAVPGAKDKTWKQLKAEMNLPNTALDGALAAAWPKMEEGRTWTTSASLVAEGGVDWMKLFYNEPHREATAGTRPTCGHEGVWRLLVGTDPTSG